MKGTERMAVSVAEDILGGLDGRLPPAVVVNGISLTRR